MSYQVSWYTEGQIMLYEYSDVISLDDLNRSNCEALALLNTATQRVDFLVDIRHVRNVGYSVNEMLAVESLKAMISHPLNGWTAYYDKRSSFAQFLVQITHQSVGGRVRFFDSQDEALAFLASLQKDSE
jgi:hypothetical protein